MGQMQEQVNGLTSKRVFSHTINFKSTVGQFFKCMKLKTQQGRPLFQNLQRFFMHLRSSATVMNENYSNLELILLHCHVHRTVNCSNKLHKSCMYGTYIFVQTMSDCFKRRNITHVSPKSNAAITSMQYLFSSTVTLH